MEIHAGNKFNFLLSSCEVLIKYMLLTNSRIDSATIEHRIPETPRWFFFWVQIKIATFEYGCQRLDKRLHFFVDSAFPFDNVLKLLNVKKKK